MMPQTLVLVTGRAEAGNLRKITWEGSAQGRCEANAGCRGAIKFVLPHREAGLRISEPNGE